MKKFVLFALLAGSMLASCASEAKVAVNQEKDLLAGITEDTFAHEDLFSTVAFNGPKKADGMLDGAPMIGIQHKFYTNALSQSVMAIRFVAAINAPDLAGTTATWTRHIYDASGNETKDETTSFTVEKAYTTLNAGEGAALNIASFAGYTNFVVYTIGNIPTSGVNNYYITASLALGGAASGESKVLATTIDQSTQFTFASADTGVFGIKKSSGAFSKIADLDDCDLTGNDSFLIVNRVLDGAFNVYGFSSLGTSGTALFNQEDGGSQFCVPKHAATVNYDFDLSGSVLSVDEAIKRVYFKDRTWWSASNASTHVKLFGENRTIYMNHNDPSVSSWYVSGDGFVPYISADDGAAFAMTHVDGTLYSAEVPTSTSTIKFSRSNGINSYNETNALTLSAMDTWYVKNKDVYNWADMGQTYHNNGFGSAMTVDGVFSTETQNRWYVDVDLVTIKAVAFTRTNPAGTDDWNSKTNLINLASNAANNLFELPESGVWYDSNGYAGVTGSAYSPS